MLGNYIALNLLLASQGQFCVIYNTSFSTWINTTGKVELLIMSLKKKKILLTLWSKPWWSIGHLFMPCELPGSMALFTSLGRPNYPAPSDFDHGPGPLGVIKLLSQLLKVWPICAHCVITYAFHSGPERSMGGDWLQLKMRNLIGPIFMFFTKSTEKLYMT